jgi:hypothetical protein
VVKAGLTAVVCARVLSRQTIGSPNFGRLCQNVRHGDSIVGVNMTTKMYMTQAQMKAKTAGMTQDQKQAMMSKNNMKMMCKSKADAMGAKMMKPPSQ